MPTSSSRLYVHRVLVRDLPAWLALGWTRYASDSSPSVGEIAAIEWIGDGEPPKPAPRQEPAA